MTQLQLSGAPSGLTGSPTLSWSVSLSYSSHSEVRREARPRQRALDLMPQLQVVAWIEELWETGAVELLVSK